MDTLLEPFREWFYSGPSRHFGHVKKPSPGPRGGRKGRKHGRARKKCERYRAEGRREANKAQRRAKHLRSHPNDLAARDPFR